MPPRFHRSATLLSLLAAFLFAGALGAARAEDEPLTTTAAVRGLAADQAERRIPVRLRGTVTFMGQAPAALFIQDETGGVCIIGPRDKTPKSDLTVGALVQVEGVTAAGQAGPYVTAAPRQVVHLTVEGEAPPMEVRMATLAELTREKAPGEVVSVQALVRSVRLQSMGANHPDALLITLADGRQRRTALLPNWRRLAGLPTHLIGASVRVRGLYNAIYADRDELIANRLLLLSMKDVQIERPAPAAWDLPIQPPDALEAVLANESDVSAEPERVRLQGVVTLKAPGKGVYVQSDDDISGGGAAWIEPADASALPEAMERIDVVGFARGREWSVALEDAVWRSLGRADMPAAPLITPEEALSGAHDARRVRLEALLLGVSRVAEEPTLVLQSGSVVFLARFAPGASGIPRLPDNSWLRITGVCVNSRVPETPHRPGARPVSFHLLVGAADAVEVARKPSWWTLGRITSVFGGLAAVAAAAVAWGAVLRRRVAHQTSQIRRHLENEAVYEERVRIARDLHDSLEQDLVGITMQLSAAEKLLARPDRARIALQLASAMVRRSQAETHRAVWDLRERKGGGDTIAASLKEMIGGLSPEAGPAVEIQTVGSAMPLPPQIENHLLRIASEAVTNARKHAQATRIEVEVRFAPDAVTLRVRDNGRGFDTAQPPSPHSGHFGLFGMRERVDKLHGKLHIESRAGAGAEITVCVPISEPSARPTPEPCAPGASVQ